MDEFSDPDFGDLFEEFANFATFPLTTSLSSTLGASSFPRLPPLATSSLQHSFFPHRQSINNNLRDSLASASSASRNSFDHFDPSPATNPRVSSSSFGSPSRSGHPANLSIATPRQPLAASRSFPQNGLPLPTQFSRTARTNSNQNTTSRNGLPSPFTRLSDPDHDFFVNEFLNSDFSSPPPSLHQNPFNPATSPVAESSTAGARNSSSTTTENNPGVKKEDDTQATSSAISAGNEMPRRQNKERSSGSAAATSWTLPTVPEKKRGRSESFGGSSDIFGDNVKTIDLVDKEAVPADLAPEKPKDIVRLSSLQCIVCMDSINNMTVTHCGHLFCGECLHLALTGKMFCPVCRQKIENTPKGGGGFTARQKGYYVMKVKLGKKKSLGKRVVKDGRVEK